MKTDQVISIDVGSKVGADQGMLFGRDGSARSRGNTKVF